MNDISNATVHLGPCILSIYVIISVFVSFDKCRHGIAGSSDSSSFNFSQKLHTVSPSGCIDSHSTSSAQGFPFLHIFATTCYFFSFDNSHSDRSEVLSHSGSDLHFLED